MTIPTTITDSDMIVLQSVESFIESKKIPMTNPEERIYIYQEARDYLYSDIARRVPRIAAYILSSDLETDTRAQGLNIALSHHMMDPAFVDILMQQLNKEGKQDEFRITGAYMATILNKWLVQHTPVPEKPKKGEKPEPVKDPDITPVKHLFSTIKVLLGSIVDPIMFNCGNITEQQAMAVASCIAMNNEEALKELIDLDLPITAQSFDTNVIPDPSAIITAALRMKKADLPKLSENQTNFVNSLKTWVYEKLNELHSQTIYHFLVSVYGTKTPDVTTNLINPKECGPQFTNLFTVAKQMINQK